MPKILRAMRQNGSPEPVFESDEDRTWFLVRLPVHERALHAATPQDTPQDTLHETLHDTLHVTEHVETPDRAPHGRNEPLPIARDNEVAGIAVTSVLHTLSPPSRPV